VVNLNITPIINGRLYAIHWDEAGEDCFSQMIEAYSDPEYLFRFFSERKEQLTTFFRIESIDDAVSYTIDEIIEMSDEIISCAETDNDSLTKLDELFEPLHAVSTKINFHQYKAKGHHPASWIRLYAIRLEDAYIITGSGLKIVKAMQEDVLLKKEKTKLDHVDEFIKLHSIYNADGIEEYKNTSD